MKITSLLALLLLLPVLDAYADPPKSGDSLGTITTTDGKTYKDAKLAVIEPDGISILYADGGAKILFTSLAPDLQKEFGYDPEKSAFYAREQQLLAQIDQLQQENAELRKQLGAATQQPQQPSAPAPAAPQPQPTIAGFHVFLESLIDQGRGYVGHRMIDSHTNALVYSGGPLDGMTEGQGQAYAQQQWEALTLDQQMAWEQKAAAYGDPIAKQEELDREEAAHPSGATIYSSDGTTSQSMFGKS